MNYAQQIVDLFGGVRELADEIRAPIQTVYSWVKRGTIPQWRLLAIDLALKERGLSRPPLPADQSAFPPL